MAEGKSRRIAAAQNEDLSNVEFETSEDVEVIPTFDNMGLRDELLRGIYAYGRFFNARYRLM
jgi:ATP-dependent RNA helicase